MRYKTNPIFSMQVINDKTIMAEIDFDIKGFSTNSRVLSETIKLFENGNDIEAIYKKYNNIYSKSDIDGFLNILINEKILVEDHTFIMNLCVAFIGEKSYFGYLKENAPSNIKFCFWEKNCIDKIEGVHFIIYAPGNAYYKDALEINRILYTKNIPYIIFRYDGSSGIIGPHVLPWQTACLECCIRQRLRRYVLKYEKEIDIQDISLLSFAKKYDREDNILLQVCFRKLINEIIYSMDTSDRQPELMNKEVLISCDNFEMITNTYAPTSDCTTCNNINQKRRFWHGEKTLVIPTFVNPFSDDKIIYRTGGLRSVGKEHARELLDGALNSLGLKIEIQLDEENHFFNIAPVYHSHLEKNYKNRQNIIWEEQLSHGKGIDKKQAYLSAGYELIERISARYFGDIDMITGSYADLKDCCIDFQDMVKTNANIKTVYDDFDEKKEIDWVWGYSLTEQQAKLVPASLVFISKNYFWGNFPPVGSSGLSAGARLEDAILQGLLEIIEHDAMLIAQCNQVQLPIVDYSKLKGKNVIELIEKIRKRGYQIISRDYTNDIGVPVIATWISNPKDYKEYAMRGVGCSIDAELALERSITEAIQTGPMYVTERETNFTAPRVSNLRENPNSLYALSYFRKKDIVSVGKKIDIDREYGDKQYLSVHDIYKVISEKIKRVMPEAEIIYVNLTRKEIKIPVVKIFVTNGIQVLGDPVLVTCDRMHQFQKKMGYSDCSVSYEDLYLLNYPH